MNAISLVHEAVGTEKNLALLEIVADYAERHPNEFDMQEWARAGGSWLYRLGVWFGLCAPLPTVGCVACHTVKLSGGDINANVPAQAQRLLGLTDDEAHSLFYWYNWPDPYKTWYVDANNPDTTEGRAWVAAQRFRHFIKTGE